MDNRLTKIKKAKDSGKTKIDAQFGLVEQHSGLLLKSGSRKITDDNLTAQTNRREYLPLEQLDSSESAHLFTKGFFTVGVIVDKMGVRTSKSGKNFCMFRVCDM